MNTKRLIIITLALGLSLAVRTAEAIPIGPKPLSIFVAPANPVLTIVEANGTLTADENGTAVALMLGGTTDHWSVSLPSGWSFSSTLADIVLGEPEDMNSKNELSAFNTNGHFTWESDIGAPNTTAPSTITVANAGTDANGHTFDLRVIDTNDQTTRTTPDNGATATLLGIALVGLFAVSRFRIPASMG